jgi:hypothetical protein
MAKSVTSDRIKLGTVASPVRLSFPRLYTPKSFTPGQPPRFEAAFLLDPSNAEHKAQLETLKKAVADLITTKWPRGRPADLKLCIEDGNSKQYDGYKDRIVVRSANKNRPVVIDNGLNELKLDASGQEPKIPYAGGYVIGMITLWAQDNQFGKRINANLLAVQWVRDGTPFGPGAVDVETEFEVIPDAPAAVGGAAISAPAEWDL